MRRYYIFAASILIAAVCWGPAFAQVHTRSLRIWNDDRGRPLEFRFGARSYVERLSRELYEQANTVCWTMYRDYRNNRGYRETYAEMYKILQDTKRIDRLVKQNYWRNRSNTSDLIAAELDDMDRLFHHIERDVRRWRSDDGRGDLKLDMDDFENTLHHMMDDYGVRSKINVIGDRDHDHRDRDHDYRRP